MESAATREVLCLWLPESIELLRRFPDSSRLLSFDPNRGLFRPTRFNHPPNQLPTILFVSHTLDFLMEHPFALETLSTSALEIVAKAMMDHLRTTLGPYSTCILSLQPSLATCSGEISWLLAGYCSALWLTNQKSAENGL
jgi:hypothetical protein